MTAAHHPVHYASALQVWGVMALLLILAVMLLALAWASDDEDARRDEDALEERRRLNKAFTKGGQS